MLGCTNSFMTQFSCTESRVEFSSLKEQKEQKLRYSMKTFYLSLLDSSRNNNVASKQSGVRFLGIIMNYLIKLCRLQGADILVEVKYQRLLIFFLLLWLKLVVDLLMI